MLISFVWLYMFKCDVYAQVLDDQTQKDFWVFYLFLKLILYFRVLCFVQNAFSCFSSKIGLKVVSREARDLELPAKRVKGNNLFHLVTQKLSLLYRDYLATNSFLRNVVWLKLDFSKFRQKLPLLSRDCVATYSFSQKLLCISGLPCDCLATVSLLSNLRKMHVFSF